MLKELKDLFILVASYETSCRMDKDQLKQYLRLNKVFNILSGQRLNYSVCARDKLLARVETYIYQHDINN